MPRWDFKKHRLTLVFVAYLAVIGLVAVGFLPRALALAAALAIAAYALAAPLDEVLLFFVRSIPFFVALPITDGFDSLNLWRILSAIIFLRWLGQTRLKTQLFPPSASAVCLWLLGFAALLSFFPAGSYSLALRRLLFFVNLSLIGSVVHDLAGRRLGYSRTLIKNLAIPTVAVILLGFLQLAHTYTIDIFHFMDFWGGVVQRNLFGNAWAEIALRSNTWLAFFGERLSLRMFSIFPDSHSFPIFVLFGLAALLASALESVVAQNITYRGLARSRGRVWLLFLPLGFLAVILSGTRGMWVAGAATAILAGGLIWWLRRIKADYFHRAVFRYVSTYLLLFFLLFSLAYPIFGSAQFLVEKEDGLAFGRRVRSSFDFSETSNARRIEIWKASLVSIRKQPWLGVGIGNFPVVVGEELARAKAGSSAHNLYLHIAAELGLPALAAALIFLWLLFRRCYRNFLAATDPLLLTYFAALLLFLPWNLFYSFTDVAIFDERAGLLFVITAGIILADRHDSTPVR